MKVCFLDLDGCLVTLGSMEMPSRDGGWPAFDPDCVSAFNSLMHRAGNDLKVVISSTWRHAGLAMATFLIKDGGCVCEIIGVTPRYWSSGHRGREIEAWLESNGHGAKFVILDDDVRVEPFQDRLVQTEPVKGLTPRHVAAALRILEAQ